MADTTAFDVDASLRDVTAQFPLLVDMGSKRQVTYWALIKD